MAIPKQNLEIYQNPLPQNPTNNILLHSSEKQVIHKWSQYDSNFIGMINISTRAQKIQGRQNHVPNDQQDKNHMPPHIPKP